MSKFRFLIRTFLQIPGCNIPTRNLEKLPGSGTRNIYEFILELEKMYRFWPGQLYSRVSSKQCQLSMLQINHKQQGILQVKNSVNNYGEAEAKSTRRSPEQNAALYSAMWNRVICKAKTIKSRNLYCRNQSIRTLARKLGNRNQPSKKNLLNL